MEKNLQRQADGRKKAPELHIEPEPMSAFEPENEMLDAGMAL